MTSRTIANDVKWMRSVIEDHKAEGSIDEQTQSVMETGIEYAKKLWEVLDVLEV